MVMATGVSADRSRYPAASDSSRQFTGSALIVVMGAKINYLGLGRMSREKF